MDELFRSVDDMFLKVNELIEIDEIKEAKELLERIVEEEPDYGRAHASLGWIYGTKILDYDKAEYHLKLAMKYAPNYPHGYHYFAYLLHEKFEANRLEAHAIRSMNVVGIDKSLMLEKRGVACEMKGKLKDALVFYKQSRTLSMNEDWSDTLKLHIKRVKRKMKVLPRVAAFLTL